MAGANSQIPPKGLFSRLWPGKDKESEMDTSAAVETAEPDPVPVAPRAAVDGSSIPPEELERLSNDIIGALKTVFDPEIPADIYELGLIYRVDIDDDRNVAIEMTLTAPACPVAAEMPGWVQDAVGAVPGVGQVDVKMVFDPPWSTERMSDEARVALNWY
jgi:FeS assembly SUF system protein